MQKLLSFIIIFFTFNISISQIDSLKNKLLVNGEISVSGSLQTGGLNLFTVKSTSKFNIDFNKISSNTYLQYGFNNTFNNVIKNDFFGYEIISIGKKKRLHLKFAGMYEKSKIKSIDNHYVLGAGLGWNVITKAKYNLVLINTLTFEEKEFKSNKTLNYSGFRYSLIAKGEYVLLKDKLIIKHDFFLNPFLFNSEDNYRYRLLTNFLMPISKVVAAKISFDYSNESIVDTGFNPENTITTFGLSIKL